MNKKWKKRKSEWQTSYCGLGDAMLMNSTPSTAGECLEISSIPSGFGDMDINKEGLRQPPKKMC